MSPALNCLVVLTLLAGAHGTAAALPTPPDTAPLDSRGFAWLLSNAVEDGPYPSLAELLRAYELSEEDLTPVGPSR